MSQMRIILICIFALLAGHASADWADLRYDYRRPPAAQMEAMPLKVALRAVASSFSGTLSSGSFTAPDAGCYKWTTDTQICRYAAKQVSITGDGTGATTNAGLILGYEGTNNNYSAIWSSAGAAPLATNYAIRLYGNSGAPNDHSLQLNAGSTGAVTIANANSIKFNQGGTAGAGPSITAGTATTDVAALSVTRTNNNAAVAKGVEFVFTDTTSAAGFLPFQVLGGAAGATNLLSVPKEGGIAFAAKAVSGTAPTLASGGCTTPGAIVANGTAAFKLASVGTGCSGSQPLVFTLPAATTGWNCTARNVSNGAISAPAQTGAESTTSVTITNFGRTSGLAAAWTDADVIVVACTGY